MSKGRPALPRIEHPNGCWTFPGGLTPKGYQEIKRNGARHRAHRWAWEQAHGSIPAELQVDHLCRNRACHNPDHLRLVTCAENIRASPRCKLNMEKARAIRCSSEEGQELARQYGVSEATISEVRHHKVWRE